MYKYNQTIFWNVDTQNDFMNPEGKLYVKGAESIKENIKMLTRFANSAGFKMINTLDMHVKGDEELSDNPDFINTFPEHCMRGSEGAYLIEENRIADSSRMIFPVDNLHSYEITKEIVASTRNIHIHKNKFNVFEGNINTENIFNALVEMYGKGLRIVVFGVALDVCVKAVLDEFTKRSVESVLITDATKNLPTSNFDELVDYFKKTGAVDIKTSKEIIEDLIN